MFEDATLIDWGVKNLQPRVASESPLDIALRHFESLVSAHEANVIVQPEKSSVLTSLRSSFVNLVTGRSYHTTGKIIIVSRRTVSDVFDRDGSRRLNKHQITEKLVDWFPMLERQAPKAGRIFDPADYWTPMFDTVSLVIAFLDEQ